MFLKLKLKGGALYIALIISIVIGIVLSIFILIAYFNQRQVLARLALTQLHFNLKSGLSMAGSQNFSAALNNKWQALPFNEDSIRIKKLQWGCYELISVESKNRHHSLKEAALYGIAAAADTALVVADRSRPIGLAGKIKFNGLCYLPAAGIKPAYIEGESFNSDGPLNAFIRQAPMQVPPVKDLLAETIKTCMNEVNPATDSLAGVLPEKLALDFSCRTALFQSGSTSITSNTLSGNIKLVASEVVISDHAVLDNILIVAAKVRIKKGFKGSLHVLAKDSIIVEDTCLLSYPSSLTLLNGNTGNTAMKGIYLGRGCVVHGALVALSENDQSPAMIKLNKNCEVYGLVYSSNYAHVQGKIFGSVYCNGLLLSTPSAVYENHLLDCELDPKKFANSLVVPAVFKTYYTYKCCKWL